MMDQTTKLRFLWTNVKPDPGAYKPYSPEFTPCNVYVEVSIPSQYVKEQTEDSIVISPMGAALAIKKLAKAIRQVQNGDESDENGS